MLGESSPSASSTHSLLGERMATVVARARLIDIRQFETASEIEIARGLIPQVLDVLDMAVTLLETLGQDYETSESSDEGPVLDLAPEVALGSPYQPFEFAVDTAVQRASARPPQGRRVADVAFIGLLELRQRRERLVRCSVARGVFSELVECDSALRRIRKAVSAADAALARLENRPPTLDFASERQMSLRVRRCYARLRRNLRIGGDEPQPAELHGVLRRIGTEFAILVGRDEYPDLRVGDRLQLRSLQTRILQWLGSSTPDMTAGVGIWRDVAAFVEMLTLVNRRQELVAHDRQVIDSLAIEIDGQAPTQVLAAESLERLGALEGLDPALDDLIARRGVRVVGQVAPIVARLRETQPAALSSGPGGLP